MSSVLLAGGGLFAFFGLALCDQNSSNIAFWDRPRVAIIRDHVYLEGGYMQTGVWDKGAWSNTANVVSTQGFLYNLSLHEPFDTTKANPAIFQSMNEGYINNYYLDGYMFADYDELYAYGGVYYISGDTQTGRTVSVPLYDLPPDSNIQAGIANTGYLPDSGNFINDVTNGAGANAPSENLSFYFSGKYNANGTDFNYFKAPADFSPYLIQVDTTNQGHAQWSRSDLTAANIPITLRLEGGLVWIPTSTRGILIYIGGVIDAADLNGQLPTTNTTAVTEATTFLSEFLVYDIGSGKWSTQAINPSSPVPPGPLAQFCTVVASNADNSQHDIFVYGGWDSNGGPGSGDVWILSVPSFTWVRANSDGDARNGHTCVTPYSDQMIVIGGTGGFGGPLAVNNSVDVFNLNSLSWTGTYDPNVYADYTPNAKVKSAVVATPTASTMSADVAGWFSTRYPSTIRNFGPFKEEATSSSAPTSSATGAPSKHHGTKAWVIAIAVVIPVVALAILAGILIFCCRKARKDRHARETDAESANKRKSWILPWVYSTSGSTAAGKDIGTDSSVTEVEHPPHSPPMAQVGAPHELEGAGYFAGSGVEAPRERWSQSTQVRSPRYAYAGPVEGMNTQVHEVEGSPRVAGSDDINYDPRNMAMYPPSVVSGGAGTQSHTIPSSSVSASGDSITPASPQSRSVMTSSGFAPIREDHVSRGDGHQSSLARAISPIDLRGDRPGHDRHPSDVSDINTSPFPSPNPEAHDSSALPRPRATRSASGDDIDEEEEHGNRTF